MISQFPKTIEEAKGFQKRIASKIILSDEFSEIKTIGAFDVSYSKNNSFTAGVIIDSSSKEILEKEVYIDTIRFPYVPTYLFMREVPSFISLLEKLSNKPDLMLIDGHGIAHPKRTGSATVFGVLANIPTIGIAKKPLRFFDYKPSKEKLLDQILIRGDFVGYRYQSNEKWNPIFISPGNKVSIKSSFTLVKDLFTENSKLPLPSQEAHNLATESKKTY